MMFRSIVLRALLLPLLALQLAGPVQANDDLLEPDKAFALRTRVLDDQRIELTYKIAKGYYLYRERFAFKADGAQLGAAELPAGQSKKDEFFGDVETYRGELRFTLPVKEASAERIKLFATSQGCADVGVCYPPYTHEAALRVAAASSAGGGGASSMPLGASQSSTPAAAAGSTSATTNAPSDTSSSAASNAASSDEARYQGILSEGRFWGVVGFFFLAGLALTFTPCVLPMIPILSGIIAGSGDAVSRQRGFILSVTYVLGVAITYTAIGIAAALSGSLLSAALQNAWVLGVFALIFVVLSLSMFGLYELQLPQNIGSKMNDTANRLQGGKITSVAAMGALSAAIVSPCVAAPLAGALLYISQTRDIALGGTALFALALGMGVPLILVGTFEGALLPKAGAWMEGVKKFFGVLLLAVAIWIVSPVLPEQVVLLLWAALAIGVAVFLHAIDRLPDGASGYARLGKAVGVLALVWGVVLAIGAAAGSRDPLQPLAALRSGSAPAHAEVKFERVRNLAELETRLASANRPVMLDFYADWCVSCKEMERFTFADEKVRARLGELTLLQVDVTANDADDKALLKRFKLFGPPGIVFFDKGGREIEGLRVIGYQPAERFLKTLDLLDAR